MVGMNITPSQAAYAGSFKDATEFALACERGRLLALSAILNDPSKKIELEQKFGKDFCMNRWPEAYSER